MSSAVNALVSGPRGRRFCLEFALSAAAPGESHMRLGEIAVHAEQGLGSTARAGALGQALYDVPLDPPMVTTILTALRAVVDSARYWQEPDGIDALLGDPRLRGPLERVARHVVGRAGVSWWGDAVDEQWQVEFTDSGFEIPGFPSTDEALRRWRDAEVEGEVAAARDRPADPKSMWTGSWWSKPPSSITTSTRAVPTAGPIGLWLVEDHMGWKAALVDRLDGPISSRILELGDARARATLCLTYPLEVSAGRRHDWFRATGREGRWVIPDWSRVAHDFDAVHLPIATYLACAGTVIPVTDDTASVIAGWDPDQTYWLRDVSAEAGSRESWRQDDVVGWLPRS